MAQTKDLVWKLLREGISVPQIVGYALAGLLGLTIVMVAAQFYSDMRPALDDDGDGLLGRDYLVVTKSVTSAGSLLGNAGNFSADELDELKSQPWCRDVGAFRASDFSIDARIALGTTGHGLRTGFFFESVDRRYLDIDPTTWSFDTIRRVVPVIIPRDYLSLYNFGFAASHGLPRVSYGQVSLVPLQFTISGNGSMCELEGRIVGFSGRLNTIVVPEEFMQWASARYGTGTAVSPTRLVVEVSSPGDTQIERYMSDHHLEVAGDKLGANRAAQLLLVVSTLVIAIGAIISVLAFVVLVMSIFLLLQRNATQVRYLLQLGYTPRMIARPYRRLVIGLSVVLLVVAVVVTVIVRLLYTSMLSQMGISASVIPVAAIIAGIIVVTLLTILNINAIKRRIDALAA